MILTADLHLTDNPADAYRWHCFEQLRRLIAQEKDDEVFILGDLTDRKDRHSAELVNRVVVELKSLINLGASVVITMGNHDKPIAGVPFWQFLDGVGELANLRFITKPYAVNKLLLLPYADDPRAEWEGIPFARYNGIFMHQTVSGAVGNNGHVLENKKMPLFPRGIKIYSGDIHTPQVINRVTYVGAPHHVNFGDDYLCRMLILNDDFVITKEVKLTPPSKHMFRVSSIAELEALSTHAHDQARVIFKLDLADIDKWPALQDAIAAWAHGRRISLASIEPDVVGVSALAEDGAEIDAADVNNPGAVLSMFCDAEEIDDSMRQVGFDLLQETE